MKTSRSETIVVQFPGGFQRKIHFPDNKNLSGQKITGIIVRLQSETAFGPNQETVTSDANIRNTYLTLTDNQNTQVISNIPLTNLIPSLNNGRLYEFEGLYLDMPKCFVYFAGTTVPANEVIVLTITYELSTETKLLEEKIRIQKNLESKTTKC